MAKGFPIQLRSETKAEWVDLTLRHFNDFLADHAMNERKASATGLMFVSRYPSRLELVEAMIQLSREELMHFHQVWRLMRKRGIALRQEDKDPYINQLLKIERHNHWDQGLLDRLLIFGMVEARGQERFALVGKHHPEPELREFYSSLAEAEVRHHECFTKLACMYFDESLVRERLNELLDAEAEIFESLPLRPAIH